MFIIKLLEMFFHTIIYINILELKLFYLINNYTYRREMYELKFLIKIINLL